MRLTFEGPNIHHGTVTGTEPLTVDINGTPVACAILDHGPTQEHPIALGDPVAVLMEPGTPPAILGKIHTPPYVEAEETAADHDA